MTGSDEKTSVGFRWLSKFFRRDFLDAQGECAEAKRQGEGQKESTREEGERVA